MATDFELSRRSLLLGGLAAGLTQLTQSAEATTCTVPLHTLKPKPERAISLRQVSAAVAAGRPPRLEGLTRLDGFITDPDKRDVILWGLSERNQPELHFEDFVVALRAANGRYYETRGGTTYRTTPLISIDPDPDMFRELRKLDVFSPSGKQKFDEICRNTPQTVRVEGMPRNTRLAKTLVDADYRMKLVSQGTVVLPISSPFPGHHTAQMAEWRAAAIRGEKGGEAWNTRYWFEAGRFNYQGSEEADIAFLDGDTVFLDSAEVVLRDEDQSLQAKGLAASGKINPLSRAFTCAWTQRMEDVYRAEPIWRDMHNVFRHFAVARVMVDRRAFKRVGFAGDLLLDRYDLPRTVVPPTLPGAGRVDFYTVQQRNGGKYRGSGTVCGGVSLDFTGPLAASVATANSRLVRRQVLAQRPDAAISWAVDPGFLGGGSRKL